jgi:site-specific DNA-methyltransferase (adenine-specific)
MEGLKDEILDEGERLKWILEEIIYMVELQPKNVFILLMLLDPNDEYKLNIHKGDFLQFDPVKEFGIKEFDLVCSNPPYQSSDGAGGKGSSAGALYNSFVERSIEISKKVIMITPSRWFIGGKGLDKFRKMMLGRNDIKYINHFKGNGSDIFGKGVDIKGGVSYFLIDKEYDGILNLNNKPIDKSKLDILLNDPLHYDIIDKIKKRHKGKYFNSIVHSRNFYGKIINGSKSLQNGKHCVDEKLDENYLKCYVSKAEGFEKWIHKDYIKNDYDNYKILTTKGTNVGKMGNTFISKPGEVCTETYLVIDCLNAEDANNKLKYINTNLFKYLFSIINNTQNASKETFRLIPILDISADEEIYEYFNFIL